MGQVAKLSKMRVIDYEVTKGNDGSEPDAPAKVESKPDGPPPAGADSEPEKVELTEQQVAIAEAVEETAEVATTVQRTTASSPALLQKRWGRKAWTSERSLPQRGPLMTRSANSSKNSTQLWLDDEAQFRNASDMLFEQSGRQGWRLNLSRFRWVNTIVSMVDPKGGERSEASRLGNTGGVPNRTFGQRIETT
ncbi:hypothetical protein QWZ10_25395 [Paracoccus cavernae]|uniref:Uncharacterized protein n=1 Tax=Paracoccus cavernae TaxID=1571207 RepID=A0ABT8DC01_9RHOB|nr:hypothetical protein [Paracoccus cavernae]